MEYIAESVLQRPYSEVNNFVRRWIGSNFLLKINIWFLLWSVCSCDCSGETEQIVCELWEMVYFN